MKSGLTWMRGSLGVSRATRLVVLQPCPGAEQPCSAESRVTQLRGILHCSHCNWHFHGSGHHSPSPQYCFFYICSGPCFRLTISLLPLKQLMWSLTPAMLRVWGYTQVPGGAARGIDRSEGCCWRWSRALCHSAEKQLRSWPCREVKGWAALFAAPWAELVAGDAGLDPGWAPALGVWWLDSCHPRQRRWLFNSCCNCALGGKNLSGSLQGEAWLFSSSLSKPSTCFPQEKCAQRMLRQGLLLSE